MARCCHDAAVARKHKGRRTDDSGLKYVGRRDQDSGIKTQVGVGQRVKARVPLSSPSGKVRQEGMIHHRAGAAVYLQ